MSPKQQIKGDGEAATERRKREPVAQDLDNPTQQLAPPVAVNQRARLAPSSLTSREVSQLQRTIGNREVGILLAGTVQRLEAGELQMQSEFVVQREDDDPLDESQVRKAIGFYANRSTQYTEEIIRQIQAGVGVPETGTVDEAMVQAVARYQQANSPLWVDGMAGPRTLPALFPSGLAEQEEIETYAEEAEDILEGDWASMSEEERADDLIARVNDRLAAANVPQVGRLIEDLGGDAGQFDFEEWSISLDQGILQSEALSDAEAADVADTVYHEARHAEQWYRMAQMRAGQGRTADQIAHEMSIPPRIANEAFGDPLAPGSMEALIADGWYQSVYGTGSAHRERVLGPTGTYEEYRALPEESDAWRVGGDVTEAYNRLGEEGA